MGEARRWLEAEPAIRAIRETVFVSEQAVPKELEWDGLAPAAGCDWKRFHQS